MTPDQIAELERLLEEAELGPLVYEPGNDYRCCGVLDTSGDDVILEMSERMSSAPDAWAQARAQLIAAAINALPALFEAWREREQAHLAGRREMFAEVMRVVDLWTGTGAVIHVLRSLDPDRED